jgi:hypothetical protein
MATRLASAIDEADEISSIHPLKEHVGGPSFEFATVIDLQYMGMTDPGCELKLALEPLKEELLLAGLVSSRDLCRYQTVQTGVAYPKDHGLAAGTSATLNEKTSPIRATKPLSLLEHARRGAFRRITWSNLLSHYVCSPLHRLFPNRNR